MKIMKTQAEKIQDGFERAKHELDCIAARLQGLERDKDDDGLDHAMDFDVMHAEIYLISVEIKQRIDSLIDYNKKKEIALQKPEMPHKIKEMLFRNRNKELVKVV
jgi:hypothetical protein